MRDELEKAKIHRHQGEQRHWYELRQTFLKCPGSDLKFLDEWWMTESRACDRIKKQWSKLMNFWWKLLRAQALYISKTLNQSWPSMNKNRMEMFISALNICVALSVSAKNPSLETNCILDLFVMEQFICTCRVTWSSAKITKTCAAWWLCSRNAFYRDSGLPWHPIPAQPA